MNCRYYTDRILSWMLNNKLIVFLSLLCFCLFVSTLALSGQKGRLTDQLEEARAALTSTVAPTEAPTEEPTENPDEATTTPEPETEGGDGGNGDNGDGANGGDGDGENGGDSENGTDNENGTDSENGTPEEGQNLSTDEGTKDKLESVVAKTGAAEATNEENVPEFNSDDLREIVKSSKLLSLLSA